MNNIETYFNLKRKWMQSNQKAIIQQEIDTFLSALSQAERDQIFEADAQNTSTLIADTQQLRQQIAIRHQIENILPFISVANFAKQYFGRSSSWLHQRINGNIVHGKPISFTPEEKQKLAFALQDVASKMIHTANNIKHARI